MSTHKNMAAAAVKHRRPIALSLVADILTAALLVFGNYYFLYEAPIRGLSGASAPLPQELDNIQPSAPHHGKAFTGPGP